MFPPFCALGAPCPVEFPVPPFELLPPCGVAGPWPAWLPGPLPGFSLPALAGPPLPGADGASGAAPDFAAIGLPGLLGAEPLVVGPPFGAGGAFGAASPTIPPPDGLTGDFGTPLDAPVPASPISPKMPDPGGFGGALTGSEV